MLRRPPISTLTDTLFPNTTLFRSGPVLGQTEVAVIEGDTPATLAARVLIAEHQLYPRVLAELVTRETRPEALLDRLREIALTLRSEEPTSALQSLMRISYAVFCSKKKKNIYPQSNSYD